MNNQQFPISPGFWLKAYTWTKQFPFACILNGNEYSIPFGGAFGKIVAIGSHELEWTNGRFFEKFSSLKLNRSVFGYLGYDLKNEIEALKSGNPNPLLFPNAVLFEAETLVEEKDGSIYITAPDPEAIYDQIIHCSDFKPENLLGVSFSKTIEKESYLEKINSIKDLIVQGLVYELNFCQFFESNDSFCGLSAYINLLEAFPMPFSGWFKANEFEISSASPERFLKKEGPRLISQPMKGTAKRGKTELEDLENIRFLKNSEKEKAENLMIVDLVRNDLARVSVAGTTKVEELFGIYKFPTVFQMISTVISQLKPELNWVDVLKSTFPMGSMTGAPKIEVMNQIENLENRKRGAFSGGLGFIDNQGDFDFNVLIRSFFINHKIRKAGFSVGSAITIDSDPEMEWEECSHKVGALLQIFGTSWEKVISKTSNPPVEEHAQKVREA